MIDIFAPAPQLMKPRILNGSHICFQTADPERVRALIPGMKEAGGYCAVPLSLESSRILRNLGIEAPSPIRLRYGWPIMNGWAPRPLQLDTAEFFTLNPRAHCHNDMRTGKTLSALWAVDFLQSLGIINKCLIVAPLSTLERVWGDEIFCHMSHKRFSVLHGSKDKRLKLLAEDSDIYVINHDGIEVILEALMRRGDIDMIVIDELAVFRNAKTKRWKAMNSVVNLRGISTWCWGLTGSPTSNEVTDAYGQAKLVRPEAVKGVSFTAFKNATMTQYGPFRWVPRRGAEQDVTRILSPSIRFARSEVTSLEPCLIERHAELSGEQKHHIAQLLKDAVTEIGDSTVTAVNAAVLVSKLVQTSCIAYGTMVLSSRGWVPIQEITLLDRVWDGVEFVQHCGVIDKGVQMVVECGGITLTPEHELLTTAGWRAAEEINHGNACEGFNWIEVRLPDSSAASGFDCGPLSNRFIEGGPVAMPLRLRCEGDPEEPKPSVKISTEREALRLPSRGVGDNPRYVTYATIPYMDTLTASMHRHDIQGLSKLRCERDNSMPGVVGVIREILGGYVGRILTKADNRPERQRWPVQPGELSMGDDASASQQQARESQNTDAKRRDDIVGGSKSLRHEHADTPRATFQAGVYNRESADNNCVAVFDIAYCGPRSRFVVQGANGELRIAHNCGVVYGADGEFLEIDFGPRLKVLEELIEENNEKVIVFLPFTGALNAVARELRKRWTVEVVDGHVSAGKRNQIFQDFQSKKDPHVLVAHPATMAHGLSLVAASLIVFYAPITSNETYTQACARIDGGGQKVKIDIAHISSTPTERKIYATIREKGRLQDVVLGLLKRSK